MSEFLIPETRATLVLDDGPFAGAEIEVNLDIGMGVYFKMLRASSADTDDPTVAAELFEDTLRLFAQHGLRAWNLRRADGPVPADLDGLMTLGPELASEIIATWVSAIGGGAAAPLPKRRRASTASSSTAASRRRPSMSRTQRASSRS